MKIFTNDALRAVDRQTIESGEATAMQLIEHVARQGATEIMKRWKPTRPTVVLAGPGNNGADALAVARLLAEGGFKPLVYLFNIGGHRLSAECSTERDMLLQAAPETRVVEVVDQLTLPELNPGWLVVDGLFGSGLRDELSGGFQMLVRKINESGAAVVALDVPSGLHGDWNPQKVNRNIVHATLTLAVAFPRISFFFRENGEMTGEWCLLDLPLSRDAIRSTPSPYYYVERHDVKPLLQPRDPFVNKSELGHLLIVAGSYGMAGASVLAARGALRSGCGRVTVLGPRCSMGVLQTAVPEAMYAGSGSETCVNEIPDARRYDCVALGPGLGTSEATVTAIDNFLRHHTAPVVLDADALGCLARRPAMLGYLPRMSVLTPHAGEFDRLFGAQPSDEARLLKAVEAAKRYGVVIVLKGRYTATVRPDGRCYFNSSGTPALATPGSGDTLTGILGSLMAQGLSPDAAAIAAVYVHGVAGSLAAERAGQWGVTATDIADATGRAIAETMK